MGVAMPRHGAPRAASAAGGLPLFSVADESVQEPAEKGNQRGDDENGENMVLSKILLIVGIVYNVSILGYYKYFDFALSTYSSVTGAVVELKNLELPLGISFFTFKAISYLVDVYSKKIVLDESPVHDALYLSFFGQVMSGPLSRYSDMKNTVVTLDNKTKVFENFSGGGI